VHVFVWGHWLSLDSHSCGSTNNSLSARLHTNTLALQEKLTSPITTNIAKIKMKNNQHNFAHAVYKKKNHFFTPTLDPKTSNEGEGRGGLGF